MIITIGREHGSNGHDIARELARQLGYKCYDKEIIEHAAELSGFSKEIFDSYDEKKVSAYVVPNPHYIGMADGFRLNTVSYTHLDVYKRQAQDDYEQQEQALQGEIQQEQVPAPEAGEPQLPQHRGQQHQAYSEER